MPKYFMKCKHCGFEMVIYSHVKDDVDPSCISCEQCKSECMYIVEFEPKSNIKDIQDQITNIREQMKELDEEMAEQTAELVHIH